MKTLIGLASLSLLLAPSAGASAQGATGAASAGLELGAVTILVKDEDTAAAWYARNLGLQVAMDFKSPEGERFVALKAGGGPSPLIVLHRPRSSQYPPLDHTLPDSRVGQETFWVWRTPDFEGTYRRLIENHVKFVSEPHDQSYGREAVFEDLYGNLFILQQPVRR